MNKLYLKTNYIIILFSIFSCLTMAIIDSVISPDYWIKTLIKILLFLILPFIIVLFKKNLDLNTFFKFDKKTIFKYILLGLVIYLIILSEYYIFRNIFDFSNITVSLIKNINVTKSNFIYVSIYISLINSLIEEFFFRGFIFLSLIKINTKRFAYIFSSLIFAIYHIFIMKGWFGVEIYSIILIGLFVGGLIFNYINEKNKNIFPSWIVHMFANFSINTIGFILF